MDKLMKWLEKYMLPIAAKIGLQRHLSALRRAFLMIIPLVLAGSLFTLIPNIYGLIDFFAPFAAYFQLANDVTFGLITIYIAIAFTHYLAGSYKINEVIVPILAVLCLFLTTDKIANIEGANYFPLLYLGTWGMFGGLAMSLYVVEFYRLLYKLL